MILYLSKVFVEKKNNPQLIYVVGFLLLSLCYELALNPTVSNDHLLSLFAF